MNMTELVFKYYIRQFIQTKSFIPKSVASFD